MAKVFDDKIEICDLRHFTHFVDFKDGTGRYQDYKTISGALRAHRSGIQNIAVVRSWVRGYSDDLKLARTVADWMPHDAKATA